MSKQRHEWRTNRRRFHGHCASHAYQAEVLLISKGVVRFGLAASNMDLKRRVVNHCLSVDAVRGARQIRLPVWLQKVRQSRVSVSLGDM